MIIIIQFFIYAWVEPTRQWLVTELARIQTAEQKGNTRQHEVQQEYKQNQQ
jgi:hypothetical protein